MAPRKTVKVVAEPTSTCKACRHAWLVEDTWLCRRFPPTVTYDYEEGLPVSSFPVTAADQTCGEFQPLLNF